MSVFIITITVIFLTIFILVGVHEFGHFIAARLLSFKVLRFSFGFGKPLICFRDKHDTEYVISALPLGGYVKLMDERETKVPESELHLSFNRQPAWKRLIVLFAGPFFNIVFACFALWIILFMGVNQINPRIGTVVPNSIAYQAGLESDQIIHSVDGRPVRNWREVLLAVMFRLGDKGIMQVTTSDENSIDRQRTHLLDLNRWNMDRFKPNPLGELGMLPPNNPQSIVQQERYNALSGLPVAIKQSYTYLKLNFVILVKLVRGKISFESIEGPVGIFQDAYKSMLSGVETYLFFLAIVSLGLAIFNLLPIPGLDGGQMVFVIAEKMIGKPISIALELLVFRLGVIFISVMTVFVFGNDLARLIA